MLTFFFQISVSTQGSQTLSVSSNLAWRTLVEELELSQDHLQLHSVRNALSNVINSNFPLYFIPHTSTSSTSTNTNSTSITSTSILL